MTKKHQEAIDLMLQDLRIKHADIRNQAKELDCEKELDELKEDLIYYLNTKKFI
jgi:hypothetical protein